MSNDNKRKREMTSSVVTNSRQLILISIVVRRERERDLYTNLSEEHMCHKKNETNHNMFRDFHMCYFLVENEILESLRLVSTFIYL